MPIRRADRGGVRGADSGERRSQAREPMRSRCATRASTARCSRGGTTGFFRRRSMRPRCHGTRAGSRGGTTSCVRRATPVWDGLPRRAGAQAPRPIPSQLRPLIAAIEANGGGLKVALFDDTTSEVLRKNEARGHGWTLDVPFDLADFEGRGEGGLSILLRSAVETLLCDGSGPVPFEGSWSSGRVHVAQPQRRAAALRARGRVPHAASEAARSDAARLRSRSLRHSRGTLDRARSSRRSRRDLCLVRRAEERPQQCGHSKASASRTSFRGTTAACAIHRGPTIDRQDGELYRLGLQAVAPDSDLVLIEGLVNIDENAHIVETFRWGRLYLDITRWFAMNVP